MNIFIILPQLNLNSSSAKSFMTARLEVRKAMITATSQTVIESADSISAMQIAAEAAAVSGISTAAHVDLDVQLTKDAETPFLTNKNAAVRALALLLDNARKFTLPSGDAPSRKRVTLRVLTSQGQVSFVVEDTGIGIPPENAERIFEEFVQLDDFRDGTGIGLTVARSLARRMGGDVQLDSSYSGGARFILTLPR